MGPPGRPVGEMRLAPPGPPGWRRSAVALVAILALTSGLPARADDTQTVLLQEFNAYVRLTERTRFFFLASLTRGLTLDTTDGELGVHLDVTLMPILRRHLRLGDWERERYLWVRVGYRLAGNLGDADDPSIEHLGILEATARVPLPWEMWLVNRGRADLRDVDGEFSSRLRYRLGLEREFTMWGRTAVPYAQAEVFYDTRFGAWSRVRYEAGVELALSERWRIEPYYRRQEDWRPSRAHENGIGLVLKYYH